MIATLRTGISFSLALLLLSALLSNRLLAQEPPRPRQIMIQALLMTVDEATLRDTLARSRPHSKEILGGLITRAAGTDPAESLARIVDPDEISQLLTELIGKGGEVISRPRVITLDGQEASVEVGEQVPFPTPDDPSGARQVGTRFSATPRLLEGNGLQLDLTFNHVAFIKRDESSTPQRVPGLHSRMFQTTKTLKLGHALLVCVPPVGGNKERSSLVVAIAPELVKLTVASAPEAATVADHSHADHNKLSGLRGQVSDLRNELARLTRLLESRAGANPPPPRETLHARRVTAVEPLAIAGLRRLQDEMVQLDFEVVGTSTQAIGDAGLELVDGQQTLSPREVTKVRRSLVGSNQTKTLMAPRMMMHHKQVNELNTLLQGDREFRLMLCGAIADDRQTVRLNLAVNSRDAADVLRSGVSASLNSGHTLALDITDRVESSGSERGVPMLSKVPHVNRLFKNVGPIDSDARTLLLITPRICSAPEEEQPRPTSTTTEAPAR